MPDNVIIICIDRLLWSGLVSWRISWTSFPPACQALRLVIPRWALLHQSFVWFVRWINLAPKIIVLLASAAATWWLTLSTLAARCSVFLAPRWAFCAHSSNSRMCSLYACQSRERFLQAWPTSDVTMTTRHTSTRRAPSPRLPACVAGTSLRDQGG